MIADRKQVTQQFNNVFATETPGYINSKALCKFSKEPLWCIQRSYNGPILP